MVSSLLSDLSGYVDIGLVLLCCSGIDLHFPTKVRSSLGDRMRLLPERYDGCEVPWCLYLRTIVCTDERCTFRHLEIAPKDEPDLWRSTIFSEVLADLF